MNPFQSSYMIMFAPYITLFALLAAAYLVFKIIRIPIHLISRILGTVAILCIIIMILIQTHPEWIELIISGWAA